MTAASHDDDVRTDIKSLLEIAALIAGFGAFITALLVYFGWVRTRVLFDYFGVPISILQYSNTEYVLRSADVLFKPAIWTILALGALAAISLAAGWVERGGSVSPSLRPIVRAVLLVATLGCLGGGLAGLVGRSDPAVSSVLLCVSGALVILQYVHYRTHTYVRPPTAMLAIGLLLTLAAVFWAVSIYANQIGVGLAADIAAGRLPRPNAVVYSSEELAIAGHSNADCAPTQEKTGCAFVYTGYQLLAYSDHRWILIRDPWFSGSPTVILPDNDSVRVELSSR